MTEPLWILLTASREWRDPALMRASFLAIQHRFSGASLGLVHGGARGGDRMGGGLATELGWAVDPMPCTDADWRRYGYSAGHRRNAAMIASRQFLGAVAFPLGLSAGTRGCMVLAEDAGLAVWNRGEPALPDGLYQVAQGSMCGGFVVARGVVTQCAPILRRDLPAWWRLATHRSTPGYLNPVTRIDSSTPTLDTVYMDSRR